MSGITISVKDVQELVPETFWKFVLQAWASYAHYSPETIGEIRQQYLWYNHYIRCDGFPYINNSAYQAGIKTINDITLDDGTLMTYEAVTARYGACIQWLKFSSLCSAIPRVWLKKLHENCRTKEDYVYKYDKLCSVHKPGKVMYMELTTRPNITYNSFINWTKVDGFTASFEQYVKNYNERFQLTIYTKMQDFQYRLLMKKLPSNRELFRWKIRKSEQCDFCQYADSIEHTLFLCCRAQRMWDQFAMFITETFEGDIFVININEMIFNRVSKQVNHVANLFCLILKQLIYRTKCTKDELNFHQFLHEIKFIENIERKIARTAGKSCQHAKKWKQYDREDDNQDYFELFINDYISKL